MSAAELDHAALAGLDALGHAAELSVVLGAGASVAAGPPDWDTLAVRLLVGSGTVQDEATARAFLSRQDPALAAEAARAGAPDWNELVRRALYEEAEEPPEPTVLHLAVAGLAAKRPVEEVQLLTLNFDLVELERDDDSRSVSGTTYANCCGSSRGCTCRSGSSLLAPVSAWSPQPTVTSPSPRSSSPSVCTCLLPSPAQPSAHRVTFG